MNVFMNPEEIQNQIISEFKSIHTWEEKYKRIIDVGKALEPLANEYKREDLKVVGCQSQVWIFAQLDKNKNIIFKGDSDALIVRGLVALLLRVYSGSKPDEVLSSDIFFIEEIGLKSHLSPSRTNGLYSMVKQIKYYAAAFKALQS